MLDIKVLGLSQSYLPILSHARAHWTVTVVWPQNKLGKRSAFKHRHFKGKRIMQRNLYCLCLVTNSSERLSSRLPRQVVESPVWRSRWSLVRWSLPTFTILWLWGRAGAARRDSLQGQINSSLSVATGKVLRWSQALQCCMSGGQI